MGFMGADTEQLMDLARMHRDRSTRMQELRAALDGAVSGAQWTGPDADAFRSTWSACGAQISLAGENLGGVAERVALEVAQQDATSDPDGVVDTSAYDGLVGGEGFLDWSDVINGVEGVSDLWRERVEAGNGGPLGDREVESNPNFDPTAVPLDEQSIKDAQIQQGALGDCWFMAALMAAQQTDPGLLARNVEPTGQPPGSEGWDVKLFIDGDWKTIHVSPDQLGTKGARSAGSEYGNSTVGFASIYEQAMINAVDGSPSGVSADTPAAGIEMVTGRRTSESDSFGQPSFAEYKRAIDEGRPVTVMTDPIKPIGPQGGELVNAHVYQVTGYDESTGEIILKNPHGPRASTAHEVRIKPDDPRFAFDIFMTGIGE